MGLTEADAKALVSEGILSADYDEHKEAIEFYDKALKNCRDFGNLSKQGNLSCGT